MICKKPLRLFLLCAGAAILVTIALGQTPQGQTWVQDIEYLESLSPDAAAQQSVKIELIRANAESWLRTHPGANLQLAAAPTAPLTPATAENELQELRRVVRKIIQLDPNHPFHLGTVTVNVNDTYNKLTADIAPLTDSIGQAEIARNNLTDAAQALSILPGVTLEHSYSKRNQVMISIHGFDNRQIPLYIDGIQMNNPYDGTLDYRLIPTANIAELQVAKGFSSPHMGPNAVGGAVNIVTRQPQKRLEGDALIGTFSGDGLIAAARLGSRWQKFIIEGSLDWLQSDYIPISGKFIPTIVQTNYRLNDSDSQSAKYMGRIGYMPRGEDAYIFSYINQKSRSGIPLDAGHHPFYAYGCDGPDATQDSCWNPKVGSSNFRSWGFWNKTSYYFHSNTKLNEKLSLKTKAFYDQYPNLMLVYQVPNPITVDRSKWIIDPTQTFLYDDHSDGASVEVGWTKFRNHSLSASVSFKDDLHKEYPIYNPTYPSRLANGGTVYTDHAFDRQQFVSIGLQDIYHVWPSLTVTLGAGFDHIDGLAATDGRYYTAFTQAHAYYLDYAKCTNTNPADFTACTPHQWAFSPMILLNYSFWDSHNLYAGYSQKTRFPGMKEMYATNAGRNEPNPYLASERSRNIVVGYSRTFHTNTVARLEYFFSALNDPAETIQVPDPGSVDCPGNKGFFCNKTLNVDYETHQGVELTLNSKPAPWLSLDGNYTYLNKTIGNFVGVDIEPCGSGRFFMYASGASMTLTKTSDNTCQAPTQLPKHKALAMANVSLPHQAQVNSTLRYEAGAREVAMYTDYSNITDSSVFYYEVFRTSNFATWDVSGSIPVYKGGKLQAGVKNLLDRNYFYSFGHPEEGRNWYVNFRYSF